MIRILLVDDHQMVRETMRLVLETVPDFKVIADVGSGFDAVEIAGQSPAPHVVLMDIEMPGLSGFATARQITKQRPDVRIVFLSMHAFEEHITEAIQMDAAGYVSKDATIEELITAIRSAHEGRAFYSPRILENLVSRARKKSPAKRELSARQLEILKLVAEGRAPKEIGVTLGIATKTVEAHKHQIMKGLAIHSTTDLVKYAVRKKIIHLREYKGSHVE